MDSIRRNVLLVDDDKINNFLNEKLLRKTELFDQIHVVLNGQEAMEFLLNKKNKGEAGPRIILLDINMPVMDGFEFLDHYTRTFSTDKKKTQIIMLTTSTNSKDVEKISQAGISGYINKPLTTEKLMTILNTQ